MAILQRITNWLETHWVTPAYSGWLLLGLSLCFFGAATNTMAGWLYVMSGVMFAMLLMGAILPERALRGVRVRRRPIAPVTAGDALAIEMEIENQTHQAKTLIQLQDGLPAELGAPARTAIELIPPQGSFVWRYECPTSQRGVYRWRTIERRTAAPVGLFWCRRIQKIKAAAIVYPTVLPLTQCPIVDAMGQDNHPQVMNAYHTRNASQDLTRTLRPYRSGDSMRLIHWRTSARYGDLRVRELETDTGGQEIIVALDNGMPGTSSAGDPLWEAAAFEQAVVAAASLFFYALRRQTRVSLWTASGQVSGEQAVLETLAAVRFDESCVSNRPKQPLLWLTQNPNSLHQLPEGSRWLLWQRSSLACSKNGLKTSNLGLVIQPDFLVGKTASHRSLQLQLQEAM